jgi:predicted flap endonuclease-1-like 5' DNA nuclease
MNFAEDMWLRGQAAQRNLLHVTSYSTAFAGTAALQALHLGLTAPQSFWAAMARAAAAPAAPATNPAKPKAKAKPAKAATASVVPMTPDTPVPTAAEAVAVAPVVASAPVAVPDPVPAMDAPGPHLLDEPRGGKPDDLTVLAGVGARLATALNEFGIYHYDQIAALDDEGIAWLDTQQKGFRMICARYDLVGQARALS